MAILNFNARTVDPNTSFDPLPAGWYNAKMIESELKPTRAGDGSMLAVQYEILDGSFAGRRVFHNFNMENKNPVAVEIAQKQLSALCHSAGVIDLQDSQQLHGIPIQIKLKVRPASGDYDASNDVTGFRDQQGRDPKDIIAAGGAPRGPAAPSAPAAAPAVRDPLAAAVADGWIKHPTAAGYHYKGEAVLTDTDVAEQYLAPAPAAAPSTPAAPPAAPVAGGTAAPPWAAPKA